jgi:hypothetical protein
VVNIKRNQRNLLFLLNAPLTYMARTHQLLFNSKFAVMNKWKLTFLFSIIFEWWAIEREKRERKEEFGDKILKERNQ